MTDHFEQNRISQVGPGRLYEESLVPSAELQGNVRSSDYTLAFNTCLLT
jgi:hypothetical protein